MNKTYCFIFRRFDSLSPETMCIKACGYVQAMSEAMRRIDVSELADYRMVLANRTLIRHCMDAMTIEGGWN